MLILKLLKEIMGKKILRLKKIMKVIKFRVIIVVIVKLKWGYYFFMEK